MLDARRRKPAVPEERSQAEPRSVRVITGITGLKKRSDLGLGCVLRLEEDLEECRAAPRPREIGQAESAADGACQQTGGNLFQETSDTGDEQPARDRPIHTLARVGRDSVEVALHARTSIIAPLLLAPAPGTTQRTEGSKHTHHTWPWGSRAEFTRLGHSAHLLNQIKQLLVV